MLGDSEVDDAARRELDATVDHHATAVDVYRTAATNITVTFPVKGST